jgi:hypothetical protein
MGMVGVLLSDIAEPEDVRGGDERLPTNPSSTECLRLCRIKQSKKETARSNPSDNQSLKTNPSTPVAA